MRSNYKNSQLAVASRVRYSLVALPLMGFSAVAAGVAERPNIVCIVSEDNTKDYMSLFCEGRGVETPAIEALACEGVLFGNCWSNAPVSSAARSTLISGCYGVRQASHYHRGEMMVEMADGLKMFPAYLREAGYYTANNAKEDYNIVKGDDVWDESSSAATWRARDEGQPFYYVHNIGVTHEGQMIKSVDELRAEVADYEPENGVQLQLNYPDTELFQLCYKFYCKRIEDMDRVVGKVVEDLRSDGVLDNTIIFYYGDNGGIMPNSKGYLTNTGLNVPMVVRVPERYRDMIDVERGSSDDRFVSFVDLAPTILEMAGVKAPKAMAGKTFWRRGGAEDGEMLFGYADRMGEKYDMVRTLRKGNYKYVRNFQPFNFDALSNNYRMSMPTYQELIALHNAGQLNREQELFFDEKAPEALYDIEADPYELNNLAHDPAVSDVLQNLRAEMIEWQLRNNDIGLLPEFYWIEEAGAAAEAYGVQNHKRIRRYLQVASLQLEPFNAKKIGSALRSSDWIERYWALIVCSTFKREAEPLLESVKLISVSDDKPVNRARAAECLALSEYERPQRVMCEALYSAKDPLEAALILNSMAMLHEGDLKEQFEIDRKMINSEVLDNALVRSGLKKLN